MMINVSKDQRKKLCPSHVKGREVSCSLGLLRGATQTQGTGLVRSPVGSCPLTLASTGRIQWRGLWQGVLLFISEG